MTKNLYTYGKNVKIMKAYKAFDMIDGKLQCRGFVYAIGETYTLDGELEVCKNGFHACKKMENVFCYYNITSKICEVELLGNIKEEHDKICTDKIKIIRQLSNKEITTNIEAPLCAYCWVKYNGTYKNKMMKHIRSASDAYDWALEIGDQEKMVKLIDQSDFAYCWAKHVGTHKDKMIKLIDNPRDAYNWARHIGNQDQMSKLIDDQHYAYCWARDIKTHKDQMSKLIDTPEYAYCWVTVIETHKDQMIEIMDKEYRKN